MYKDILVHLDGTEEDAVRLSYADSLALGFDAYVTGLFANLIPQIVLASDGGMLGIELAIEVENEARAHGQQALVKINELMGKLASRHGLKRQDLPTEMAGQSLASNARLADLFIATRPYGHEREAMTAGLIESVLFDSGRPCLFVPPRGIPHPAYDTVLLAWKDSRESARSVGSSLPMLRRAKSIVVALVDDGKSDPESYPARGAGILEHLRRHDLNASLKIIPRRDRVSQTLLGEAATIGADLLVMGGYGHSRLREWVLGGTTRAVLSEATIPVLVGN
jgi:nucleotide-binding universal stress UspA family protein